MLMHVFDSWIISNQNIVHTLLFFGQILTNCFSQLVSTSVLVFVEEILLKSRPISLILMLSMTILKTIVEKRRIAGRTPRFTVIEKRSIVIRYGRYACSIGIG